MHRSHLGGSPRWRAGTASGGPFRSHRNQHSRDAASNGTSHPCCAPDVLADGDTSPTDAFDASGRGNSSPHGGANRHSKPGAHARAERDAASHAATGLHPNRHASDHAESAPTATPPPTAVPTATPPPTPTPVPTLDPALAGYSPLLVEAVSGYTDRPGFYQRQPDCRRKEHPGLGGQPGFQQ